MANNKKPLFDKPIGGGPDEEGTMNLRIFGAYAKKLGFDNAAEWASEIVEAANTNRKKTKKHEPHNDNYPDEYRDTDS